MLLRVLLLLLVPSIALAQSITGGAEVGVVSAPSGGSGGAGTGVETRYVELLSDPNFVVGCSEPVDGPNGEHLNNSGYGLLDSTLSPNESECWGRGTNWQDPGYQDPPSPPLGQTIEPVTGWGSVEYASNQSAGRGDWWLAFRSTQLASTFGLTEATVCYRYYKQVSADYQPASSDCGGTTYRNKLMQVNNTRTGGASYDQYQIQEDQFTGCATPGVFTRGIGAGYGSGPGEGLTWLSPTVTLAAAVDQPIRVEQCFETSDITTGANWRVRALVTRLDTGVTSLHETPLGTYGPPIFDDFIGGDLDHTGGGESWNGYFMFAVWNTVGGKTIGAACEIEGGCP